MLIAGTAAAAAATAASVPANRSNLCFVDISHTSLRVEPLRTRLRASERAIQWLSRLGRSGLGGVEVDPRLVQENQVTEHGAARNTTRVCPRAAQGSPCSHAVADVGPSVRMPVKVLIVDDHARFRASARRLLELEGFDVVGEAADGGEAMELARYVSPDLVLIDVGLPDTSGFDVAERLAGTAKVIFTSSRDPSDLGRRVRRSGALGFVPKDELSGDRLRALLGDAA